MAQDSERLTILSDAEQFALYALPDFDDNQRMHYLSFSETELKLIFSRKEIHSQMHCALQIGYFKAKHAFFIFSWSQTETDCQFILERYFGDQTWIPKSVTKHEYYTQRTAIAYLFNYHLWSAKFLPQLVNKANHSVHRDVSPRFIVAELLIYLNENRIIRPAHTTLQTLISETLSAERERLSKLLINMLDEPSQNIIQQLLIRDEALSGLAILKQDAKHFGYRQMVLERQKRTTLAPIYEIVTRLLPKLAISRQNLSYYASLTNFYTIYDLRRLKPEQTYLYLLCYAWQRYRQFTDNLIDALGYHMKLLEDQTKNKAKKKYAIEQAGRQQETRQVGRLLLLYVDSEVADTLPFGTVRERAFSMIPKHTLEIIGHRLSQKPVSELSLRWQMVDDLADRIRRHLRPLYTTINFSCNTTTSPWLSALAWMKDVFSKQQRLSQRPLHECIEDTVPQRLRPYLLTFDSNGKVTGVDANRYEFWIYRQLRKRLKSGEIYVDDSIQHRNFADELVNVSNGSTILSQLDIPWLQQPINSQLDALRRELHHQWLSFDRDLRQGKLKHVEYDHKSKKITWKKLKTNLDTCQQDSFYQQMSFCDISDVFHFTNTQCHFLSAMTPLQPRYVKQIADPTNLMAVIIAQAMNHGNLLMAQTSDIPYHALETMYQQYLRPSSLQEANDRISNAIAALPIFSHYSFDLGILYGSVDGQKFSVERPTVKARYSRKYFGKGKGVVAYTMLCNHIPLQGWLIGAHELEAHHVFDIWYHNNSDITPSVITGDMHSINKANFAVLHWFGSRFEPRFTDLDTQLKHLYCAEDLVNYEKYLIRPVGKIDLELITTEKSNIDQIVATLGLKEITQGSLIRKLCNYSQQNPTRRAIFEFDKLIRSIYTLRYLREPQLQRNIHRSQNRIESYHQLRSVIAQVGGKKELIGKTDIEIEVSNQCARLLANIIIYYNSAILSRLLNKFDGTKNPKTLAFIKKISPVAWRHIHLNGHYTFKNHRQPIDLDVLVSSVVLG
jgi:TnpA family transposase